MKEKPLKKSVIVPDPEEKQKDFTTQTGNVLQLHTGGKGPVGGDWLSALDEGTVFLVQERPQLGNPNYRPQVALGQFIILAKFEKSIMLVTTSNQRQETYVNPSRFCNQFDLYEIIGRVLINKEDIENEHSDL